jgi:hypothetical protein
MRAIFDPISQYGQPAAATPSSYVRRLVGRDSAQGVSPQNELVFCSADQTPCVEAHRGHVELGDAGDAGFEQWYLESRDALMRAAFLYTADRDAARDLTQETFARAWQRSPTR